MTDYTALMALAADLARRELFPTTPALTLCDLADPRLRTNRDIHTVSRSWFGKYSSHEIKGERQRTLDFYLVNRPEIADSIMKKLHSVRLGNRRFFLADEPREPLGEPAYWLLLCKPASERA